MSLTPIDIVRIIANDGMLQLSVLDRKAISVVLTENATLRERCDRLETDLGKSRRRSKLAEAALIDLYALATSEQIEQTEKNTRLTVQRLIGEYLAIGWPAEAANNGSE